MSELCTTAVWRPKAGREEAFVSAWSGFAGWASGMPGAGRLLLARDTGDDSRFVSFGVWGSEQAVRSWKGSPDFQSRMARVLAEVDQFEPAELAVVETAAAGVPR